MAFVTHIGCAIQTIYRKENKESESNYFSITRLFIKKYKL